MSILNNKYFPEITKCIYCTDTVSINFMWCFLYSWQKHFTCIFVITKNICRYYLWAFMFTFFYVYILNEIVLIFDRWFVNKIIKLFKWKVVLEALYILRFYSYLIFPSDYRLFSRLGISQRMCVCEGRTVCGYVYT